MAGTALALIGTPAHGQPSESRVLAIGRPSAEAPVAREPIPAEIQAAAFLDRLEAGDPGGARAALPAGIRLGLHDFPERLDWFRLVTEGCSRGWTIVSEYLWLEPGGRPRPQRTSRLPPGHRILMSGAPPPGAEYMALSSRWDCPGEKPDIDINFYLVDDSIVRVAYDHPPHAVPVPPSPPRR